MVCVPDPWRYNRSFLIGPVLTIIVLAMMCGERDLSGIHQYEAVPGSNEQGKRIE